MVATVCCWSRRCFLRSSVYAQAGFSDDRVILQGFYWESHRHGYNGFPAFGQKKWYDIVRDQATTIREGRFDLIWFPPPSSSGDISAGYNPKEYFNLNNSYGNFQQHRATLRTLLENGIEPIADIVINHRDGAQNGLTSRTRRGARGRSHGTMKLSPIRPRTSSTRPSLKEAQKRNCRSSIRATAEQRTSIPLSRHRSHQSDGASRYH